MTAKTTAKFDLKSALINDGFEITDSYKLGGDDVTVLNKHYSRQAMVAWYGMKEITFDVEVRLAAWNDHIGTAYVKYSNGKMKDHDMYSKRAYNAIRDTIKNNGFEI